jgi:hypothetical protein
VAIFTDCDLVVIGPPADIGAMEATQTERTRAALRTGYPRWDRGGWPSLDVVRIGSIDRGRVYYSFEIQNFNPAAWVAGLARKWPRLEFRADCMLDDNDPDSPGVIYRQWYSGNNLVRSEELSQDEANHWGTAGRRRWLEEAGITDEDLAPEVPIELETPTSADTIAAVRSAMTDGSLSNDRPVFIQATVTLSVGAEEAREWLHLAEEGGEGTHTARARIEWLADAIADQD